MIKNQRGRSNFLKFLKNMKFTSIIIFTNVIFFFIFAIIISIKPEFIYNIALQSKNILAGNALWTLVTSMFMHQGIFHLFVNMFSLFFLGNLCEQLIGRKRFLLFYLIAGIFAGAFFVLFSYIGTFYLWGASVFGNIDILAVGASGALFGLLGLLVALIPRYKVYLIIGPIIVFIVLSLISFAGKSLLFTFISIILNILLFVMIFSLFSYNPKIRRISIPIEMQLWITPIIAIVPLIVISFFVSLPIGNTAHLGGLIIGLLYGIFLRIKYPKKIILISRFFK